MGDPEHLKMYAVEQSEDSFAALVQKYGGMVMGTATRITGDRGIAEEVSQNVFAIMARKAGALTKYRSLSGWLHRTTLFEARNLLKQQRRRQRKMKALSDQEMIGTTENGLPDETLDCLDQAIDRLPESDRRVILLKFFEGLNNREIGDVTGKTEVASQKQVHRALQKLSRFLERRGVTVSAGVLAAHLAEISKACSEHVATNLSAAALASGRSITHTNLITNSILTMIRKPSLSQLSSWAVAAGTVAAIAVILLPLTSKSDLQEESELTRQTETPGGSVPARTSPPASAVNPGRSQAPGNQPSSPQQVSVPSLDHNIKVQVTSTLAKGAPINVVFAGCGRQMLADVGLGLKQIYQMNVPIIGGVQVIVVDPGENYTIFADISARVPVELGGGRVGFERVSVAGEVECELGKPAKLLGKDGSHVARIIVEKSSVKTGAQLKPDQDIVVELSGTTSGGTAISTTLKGAGPESLELDLGSRLIGDKDIPIKGAIDYKVTESSNGYELKYGFGFRQPTPSGDAVDYDDYLVEGAVLCSLGSAVEIYRSGGHTLSVNIKVEK